MTKKNKRNPANKEIIKYLFENYDIKSAGDIRNALKDLFGGTLEGMLNAELDVHLGYDKNALNEAPSTNRRNGTTSKTVQSQLGDIPREVPRDRESSFDPMIVKKRQKDVPLC